MLSYRIYQILAGSEKFNLNGNTYINDIYEWIRETTPRLFLFSLEKIKNNPDYVLKKQSNNPKDILRCYPRVPSDSKIDWNWPADYIHRIIRASAEPFSGAFTFYKGSKLSIWRAELFEDNERYLAMPGQIAQINKTSGNVVVITGKGKLKLTIVSYNSFSRVKPAKIINTIRVRVGD